MLSRNNKILIGCLALLLVMSVGYALFSETITINGSATAKGDFDISTTAVDLNEEWIEDLLAEKVSKGIVENPTINVVDNEVTSNVTLGSPGSYQYFVIKVKNNGSIPAKLKSIIDKTNNTPIYDDELEEGSGYDNKYWVSAPDGKKNSMGVEIKTDSGFEDDFTSDITERYIIDYGFDGVMKEAILDPEEEAYYFIKYEWDSGSTEVTESYDLDWQIEINWEQVTS